jgi:hypothetical protein
MKHLQAINGYRQTERAFAVLFERLAAHEVHQEIRSCLVMIIEAIEQRNYQHANEIYLQLSIGNQAWPIGVTSIGIHDRTAREKLSYYSNVKSQAHIMNDEATRKYLHGLSRLIKAVQGLRPTDPSRSVNFNAIEVRINVAVHFLFCLLPGISSRAIWCTGRMHTWPATRLHRLQAIGVDTSATRISCHCQHFLA